jgi:hypothetical protein
MKVKLADWIIKFLNKNHTHNWEEFGPEYKLVDKKVLVPKKCRYCRTVEWRSII